MAKLLLVAAAFILVSSLLVSSCEKEPWNEVNPGEGESTIVVHLQAPSSYSPPQARSAKARSLDYNSESTIDTIYVLIFDASNVLVDIKMGQNVTSTPGSATQGVSGVGSFSIKFPTSYAAFTHKLVVLANAQAMLRRTIGTDASSPYISRSYADVTAAIYGQITGAMYASGGRIPMWGETGQISIASGSSSPQIMMTRAVARIDVGVGQVSFNSVNHTYSWDGKNASGGTIPFALTNVYIIRPNDRYAVIPDPSKTDGNPTVPAGATAFSAVASEGSFGFSTPLGYTSQSVYVPESDVRMGASGASGDNNHTNRMALIVGGRYSGSSTVTYYRLDFSVAGSLINVLRNHLYQFNISSVLGAGLPTVQDAYASQAMNMTVEVLAWKETDINNIVFDGSSYFAIDRSEVHFSPSSRQTEIVKIRTNIPGFQMKLGSVTHMQAGGQQTYTDTTTGFVYTLSNTGPETYTLAVSSPIYNISRTQTTRAHQWTFVAGRLNMGLLVDQAWTSSYVSQANGATTTLYPEGTNGTDLPFQIISSDPVAVSVSYSGSSSTGWLSGVVTNPPQDEHGHYIANMSLSVPTYVYGTDGTTDRRATITVTPQGGGTASAYTIVQQAPYITLSPNRANIARPSSPTTINTTVNVLTNILTSDILAAVKTSADSGAVYMSNSGYTRVLQGSAATHEDSVAQRNLRFTINSNMTQEALNNNSLFSSTFTVGANAKYGTVASAGTNSVLATIAEASDIFTIYWNQADFNGSPTAYAWKAGGGASGNRYSDANTTYVFPWNTTKVDVDAVSNIGTAADASMGTAIAKQTPEVDRGGGVRAYPYTYTIPVLNYTNNDIYFLRFNSTHPEGVNRTLYFERGSQYFSRTGTTGTVTSGFRGTTTTPLAATSLTAQSNVQWTVATADWTPAASAGWVTMSKEGTTYSASLSFDDRVYAPVATTNYNAATDLVSPTRTVYFNINRIDALNPLTGFNNGMRSVTVTFTNSSYDATTGGKRGAANPPSGTIVQYAPRLSHTSNTLPAGTGHIPYTASSYSFIANTNLQGWGVKVFNGPYDATTNATPLVQQPFGNVILINTAAASQDYTTSVTVPANNAEANRTLYFYLYCNEFPNNLQLVGQRIQDYWVSSSQASFGSNNFLYLDGANRLRVGKVSDGLINSTLTTSSDGTLNFTTNLAYFKFGSVIAFDGNGTNGGAFGSGSVKWNPSGRLISSYGDILCYNAAPTPRTDPAGFYISDPTYHTWRNVRQWGQGDPCRLAGYLTSQIGAMDSAQFTAAMAASEWRAATATENALLAGGAQAPLFDPANPSVAGVNYIYVEGNAAPAYKFVVPFTPNVRVGGVWLPVIRGELVSPDGMYFPGGSIRGEGGALAVEASPQTNFWSGTTASTTLFYCLMETNSSRLQPTYQRSGNIGMPVRCVRRNTTQ